MIDVKPDGGMEYEEWTAKHADGDVPIFITEELERATLTVCAVFSESSGIDPWFWRATSHTSGKDDILWDITWAMEHVMADKPKPVAILAGIFADIYFAGLSGRLFGDDTADASGETAAIFRLVLALLPELPCLEAMLAVVRRFGPWAKPWFGRSPAPDDAKDLAVPGRDALLSSLHIEDDDEMNTLLKDAGSRPSRHSGHFRPALRYTTPRDSFIGAASKMFRQGLRKLRAEAEEKQEQG